MDRKCKYCKKVFDIAPKVFSNHVRWCEKNPKRNDTKNLSAAMFKMFDATIGPVVEYEVQCHSCGKKFFVKERTKNFPEKEKYFCGRACANKRVMTEKRRKNISDALRVVPRETRRCLMCNKKFEVRISSGKRYCSVKCGAENNKSSNAYLRYRGECKFKFNVYHYPEEFDIGLINEHGWYKAVNNGNNLGGVSRDHKISVKYGWEHGISAEIISHPANCRLILNKENQSKRDKCSIELKELNDRIKEWNKKYKAIKSYIKVASKE